MRTWLILFSVLVGVLPLLTAASDADNLLPGAARASASKPDDGQDMPELGQVPPEFLPPPVKDPGQVPYAYPAGPAFPRLSMWHPGFDRNTLEDCARYDVAVGNFQVDLYWDPARGRFATALRKANPNMVLLTYFTNSVIRHSSLYGGTRKSNPFIKDWPAKWFLTEAGTTLATAIDAKQETIAVSEWEQTGQVKGRRENVWEIFRTEHDVLCDGEIMTIVATDKAKKTITVTRGMNGTKAAAHGTGLRIAPIVRFWAGSYIMNLTNDCPTAELHGGGTPETWADYSFRMSKRGVVDWWWYTGGDQDGFLFDLMADTITWTLWGDTRCIDLNQDNVSDRLDELDSKWKAGIDHVTDLFHRDFPGLEIMRNNSRCRRYGAYNGENFESFPQSQWATWDEDGLGLSRQWHRFFFGDKAEERGGVVEFATQAAQPNYTMISTADLETDLDKAGHPDLLNPKSRTEYKPDLRKMRWGLTTALLSGTYYCWVIDTDGHGQRGLLWFDEYDDSGNARGYLGYPLGGITKVYTHSKKKDWGAWGREFQGGYVICNPTNESAKAQLPPGRWIRLKGRQDPIVNNGQIEQGLVTIPAYDGLVLKRLSGEAAPK